MIVAFLCLHLDAAFEQITALQVVHDEREEDHVGNAEARPLLREVLHEEAGAVADAKVAFWCIVENEDRNLVTNSADAEELWRGDPREYRVQEFGQSVTHRVPCRQRRT